MTQTDEPTNIQSPHQRQPQTVCVTGANRGIGLEFCKQYLETGAKVFACTRQPEAAELKQLTAQYPDALHLIHLDVTQEASILSAFQDISSQTASLDLLINNAGVAHRTEPLAYSFEQLRETFLINAVGPIFIAKVFLPLLKAGQEPWLINISSFFGSIHEQNKAGTGDDPNNGPLAYCASKAALNMASVKLHHELIHHGIHVISQGPGWAKTAMGTQKAPYTAETVVRSMIQNIAKYQGPPERGFYEWNGEIVSW